jgi:MoxR-like ATPase
LTPAARTIAPHVSAFVVVEPADRPDPSRLAAFDGQRRPPTLASHEEAAAFYRPDAALIRAVNAAMIVGAPLLLTGEAGTGKTQVAYWLRAYLGLGPNDRLFALHVQSTTTARDLLYSFDNVAYFHAANDRRMEGPIDKWKYLRKGPLWEALDERCPRGIVLIDEVDKAPRDFPNDLLHVLDKYAFEVPELGHHETIRRDRPPPFVVITSNSERKLPEPFLRRCIFHHIELTEELVTRAVAARQAAFADLSPEAQKKAIDRFFELREKPLRKKPATAELLVWLVLLGAHGADAATLARAPLRDLPALGALLKDRDDLDALR